MHYQGESGVARFPAVKPAVHAVAAQRGRRATRRKPHSSHERSEFAATKVQSNDCTGVDGAKRGPPRFFLSRVKPSTTPVNTPDADERLHYCHEQAPSGDLDGGSWGRAYTNPLVGFHIHLGHGPVSKCGQGRFLGFWDRGVELVL